MPNLTSHHYTAAQRLMICRMLDQAGPSRTDRAIASALAREWTPNLAARFGPPPAPRTARRWDARRGAPGGRASADMADRPRGPRPDGRHAMLLATALRAAGNAAFTIRDLHDEHCREVRHANAAAARAGRPAIRPLSYSTTWRTCHTVARAPGR